MKRGCFLAILTIIVVACNDIFETDISNISICVVSPKDSVAVKAGRVTFAWRTVNSATRYQLTIVEPSFAQASTLIADTVLCGDSTHMPPTSFSTILDSGKYQWSIKAFNSAYATYDQIYTLIVNSR